MSLMTSTLAAAILSASAAGTPAWQDPEFISENRMPMTTTFATEQQQSIPLNGMWQFRMLQSPEDADEGFAAADYDDSSWDEIQVPGMWDLQGWQDPVYVNTGWSWRGHFTDNPPEVPAKDNHVGQYRRTFTMDKSWSGKQVRLCVGSATSNLAVWVNGKYVGYSEDSKLEATFDITKYVKPGENVVALEIFRWCDGSYLEDQDFWRLNGIARGVWVYSREAKRIEDLHVSGDMDGNLSVMAEVTPGITGVSYEVWSPDGSCVAKFDSAVPKKYEESENGDAVLRTSATVPSPELWSAESPSLYTLHVAASDGKGVRESTSIKFGFRTVEIKDAQLLVNGKPILIKGVDRHEMDPHKGYQLSREDMVRDILVLKRLNVNAVRTCHYPDSPLWYELCDEYGLYVTDEANIESHGMGYGEETLAKRADYTAAHLARNQRMVQRDYNHPCVIVWSLGNEAGNGVNFEKCYEWVKQYDSTRPVQYERALNSWNTDIYCPMYYPYDRVVKYCEGNPERPLIQCEYAHAMGNSEGGLKEYWDLVRKYPTYQGGYIWDFMDQALWAQSDASETGSDHFFAFGGDYNDYDGSDGTFNCNGVVAADRSFHPHSYEVRYQYQNIFTDLDTTSSLLAVNVYNENFFTDLSRYRMEWTIEAGGVPVHSGIVEDVDVAPGETKSIGLGMSVFDAQIGSGLIATDTNPYCVTVGKPDPLPDCDIYLNVRYVLKSQDGILPAGEQVAYDQIVLYEAPTVQYEPSVGEAPSRLSSGGKETFSGEFAYSGDMGASWEATFDRATGSLCSYKVAGKEMLAEPLTPSFGRAPTENDMGAGLQERMGMWQYPDFRVKSFDVSEGDGCHEVIVEYKPLNDTASVKISYQIFGDGSITGLESMSGDALENLPPLFRFGMKFAMPGRWSNVDYFGKGPWENYSDRSSAAMIGRYRQSVDEQYHYGYVRTQESGTKTDLRWYRILDDDGTGLEISSDVRFSASALPFSQRDLDVTLDDPNPRPNPTNTQTGRAQHSLDMVAKAHPYDRSNGTTYVNFELVQMGVGCVNSWGALPLPQYMVPAAERHFLFVLRPVGN